MNVEQIMTSNVACCGIDSTLAECAQMMLKNDCGCIPVTEHSDGSGRVVGVITDRDIACRAVAKGLDPTTVVAHCMSASPAGVHPGTNVLEAEKIMEEMQIRRIPILADDGSCLGMLSQADIALATPGDELAMVVKHISMPKETKH